jgi:feruloyl-CoA synthase
VNQVEYAAVDFAPPRVLLEGSPESGFLFRSALPLQPWRENLGQMLKHWAEQAPERIYLAERAADGNWRELSYAEVNRQADAIAQALLDRRLGPYRPVMILSGNSIEHALLMLGCFIAGVPVVPVSVAYSLLSKDFLKLRFIFEEVCPGLVYVADAATFATPLAALKLDGVEVVAGQGSTPDTPTTPFAELLDGALQRVTRGGAGAPAFAAQQAMGDSVDLRGAHSIAQLATNGFDDRIDLLPVGAAAAQ